MFPYEYINEILDIARANDKSWDIGLNMFINNVQDAYVEDDQYFYHGADQLDYKELYDKYLKDRMHDSPNSWYSDITNEFNAIYRANQSEVIRMRREGCSREELKAFFVKAAEEFLAEKHDDAVPEA